MKPFLQVLLAASLWTAAVAQAPAVPKFDPTKETTIKGVVTEINNYSCPITGTVGTHLMVKSGLEQPLEVHVASAKFLQEYGISLKPGDNIQAVGYMGTFHDKPAFLPRLIMVGASTYYLRDKKGNPLW